MFRMSDKHIYICFVMLSIVIILSYKLNLIQFNRILPSRATKNLQLPSLSSKIQCISGGSCKDEKSSFNPHLWKKSHSHSQHSKTIELPSLASKNFKLPSLP
jgi:hypothetical protein